MARATVRRSAVPSTRPRGGSSHRGTDNTALHELQRTAGNKATTELVKGFGKFPQPAPGQSAELLGNGKVSTKVLDYYLAAAKKTDVEVLDHTSDVVRNILKYPLHESWNEAKDRLAYVKDPVRNALMQKLVDFRGWHWVKIVERTQAVVNDRHGEKGLNGWPAAGSTSLTSDIDVNLKGTSTEEAVQVFNAEFKKDGWKFEPGVSYDVNVYAMDFMHAFKGIDAGDGMKVVGKEGKRAEQSAGGFKEKAFQNLDIDDQNVWALVKARIYMDEAAWLSYAKETKAKPTAVTAAKARYQTYLAELQTEMHRQANKPMVDAQELSKKAGISSIGATSDRLAEQMAGSQKAVLSENLKMAASNRVYEGKLAAIRTLRSQLAGDIAEFDALVQSGGKGGTGNGVTGLELLNGRIELKLRRLRESVSEAALWSNEAYITDAAVNHAVVGMQGGNPIHQTASELLTVVTENMADAVKEINRHGAHLHEAGYKASKYMLRMTDAAKNAGLGEVKGLEAMYKASYEIAVRIKGGEGEAVLGRAKRVGDKDSQVELILKEIGITSVKELIARIVALATAIQQEGDQKFTRAERHFLATPSSATKNSLNRA
ncbi:MAG: hypothetical protein ACR2H3_02795 [Acidimicrobiales bacterium]